MNNLLPYIKALEPITSRTRCNVTAIKKDGKVSFTKQGLTDNRLIAHLENKLPRGVYPIKPNEDTCRVALLDLDSHKGKTPLEAMFSAAKTLRDHMLTKGIHVNSFLSSGGKGIHLYTLWDAPQDAYSVRQLLIEVLADCGYKNGTGGVAQGEIEIFPKQDKVRADGVGSMFILPLTGHSAPIDLNSMTKLDREAILSSNFWQFSYDVPKKERKSPMRPLSTISGKQSEELKKSARYISVLDPDMGYDEWLKVGMALHQISQGSDDGFFVWDDWSSQGEKYTGSDLLRSKWDSFKL